MATLRIQVKNGKFFSHNNVDVQEFYSKYLRGNGWICKMHEDGSFHCVATGVCDGVECRIKFKIQDGYVKLTLKMGADQVQVLKRYEIGKWPEDGVIGLTSGPINERRAYFRGEAFQNFLDEYGITSVRYMSANYIYPLEQELRDGTTIFEEKIETDGKTMQIFEAMDYPEGWSKNSCMLYRETQVSGATWVIKNVIESGVATHRILFTDMSFKQLEGLPKE